jgi:hypothetical protein
VCKFAKKLRNEIKPPKLMDLYSDYLLSSPNAASATMIVKVLNDAYSHNAVTRMPAQPEPIEKSKKWVSVAQADLEPDSVCQVRVKDVPFTLHLVKKVYHNLNGSVGVQYLLSGDTTQDAKDIYQTYQKRWSSEDLHRSLKQNTALEKMPAKMPCSQANHIFASVLAQVKLEVLKIASKKNHYTLKKQILIEALKSAWRYLQELKNWSLEKNINFPNFEPA